MAGTRREIPLTKNTRHPDIPGIEFFEASGSDSSSLWFVYCRTTDVFKDIASCSLDVDRLMFCDNRLGNVQITDKDKKHKFERAMQEMARRITWEIKNYLFRDLQESLGKASRKISQLEQSLAVANKRGRSVHIRYIS